MIDLHIHLDGSLSMDIINYLIDKYDIKVKKEELDNLDGSNSNNLKEYLDCFKLPVKLLQSPEAIKDSIYLLLSDLKKKGIIYVELRFAPQLHATNYSQEEIVEAAIDGMYKSCLKSNLILCMMRNGKKEDNIKTIWVAKKFLGNGVCAIDLAGDESNYKTKDFKSEFELAKSLNIPFTIHAGEADEYSSVIDAINFGASRIGHGINSINSTFCLNLLKEKKIGVEMCPSSNFQTKASSISDYPIKKFIDYGIMVNVNTDNMMVSNTNIFKEFDILKKNFGFNKKDIKKLLINACCMAFITDSEKEDLKQKINKLMEE